MAVTTGKRLGTAALAIALCSMVACTNHKPDTNPNGLKTHCPVPVGLTSIGEEIPSCSFEGFDGQLLKLDDLLGKPTVINFWATWCTFCISEMPALQTVYSSLNGRVWFLGADLLDVQGETRAAATAFGKRTGVKYPLVFDTDGILFGHFAAKPILPVTIFVRANGKVAYRRFGPMDAPMLRGFLKSKLGITS